MRVMLRHIGLHVACGPCVAVVLCSMREDSFSMQGLRRRGQLDNALLVCRATAAADLKQVVR